MKLGLFSPDNLIAEFCPVLVPWETRRVLLIQSSEFFLGSGEQVAFMRASDEFFQTRERI